MTTATPSSRLAQLPKLGRASRSLGRLWQVPTFLAGLGIFLAVAVSAPLRRDPAVVQFEEDVRILRLDLASSGQQADILVARAENLLSRLPKFTRKSPEVNFLVGSAFFRAASQYTEPAASQARARAVQHLEEAFTRGVAPADEPVLYYRLGWTIYHQSSLDKDIKRAVELLKMGIEKGSETPGLAYGLLIEAHLKMTPPDLEGALAASQKQLELTDDRNVPAMAQARLTNAELLLKQNRRPDAIKEFERIGHAAPPEIRIPAKLAHAAACAAEGWWSKAIPIWKELLDDAAAVPGGRARILYHLGLCHQNADPADSEEAARVWMEALALGGDDARAAGLRLGELRMTGPNPDPTNALEHWTHALATLRSSSEYQGKHIPMDRARAWLENGFKIFLETQDFARAEAIAVLYKKLAEPGRAEQLQAEALHALALDTRERMKAQPTASADKKREEMRGQFHRAAVAYDLASTLRKTPTDILWQASQCYVEAGNNAHAVKALNRFVRMEKDESRLAEAYLTLAEAHTALGEKDKSLLAYYKCIEYPNTPFAHRARYQVALEEIDKKNFVQAREILEQILKNPMPTLDRSVHEQSIYKMAGLLLQLQHFRQAAIYLKEASRQYPDNPLALAARDQLAESYRRLADQDKARMDAAKSPDTRSHYRLKRLELLEDVFGAYQEIVEELETKGRAGDLSAGEQAILRRALFGAADARFDRSEFNEALRLYQGIQTRYRKKIESLLACQRTYKCVGVMIDSPTQIKLVHSAALQAVAYAREDLASLTAEADIFRGPGVWSKDEWTSRLAEINERLLPAAAAKSPGPIIR